VKVTAYFTTDLPPPFSDVARYTKDLLEEYRAASGGQVSFEFIDPQTQETAEDKEIKKEIKRDVFGRQIREKTSVESELSELGISAVEVRVFEEDQAQTKRAYMGIVVRYGEEQEALPVVQDTSTLEYDLTTMVRRLVRKKLPVVGVLQGHGEPDMALKLGKMVDMLKPNYEVKPVAFAAGAEASIPDDVDTLLVIGPINQVPDDHKKAIDAFMMKGKAAAFFIDRKNVDYSMFDPKDLEANLDDLISTYGIELGTQMVGDTECASLSVSEKRSFMVLQIPIKYPFIPLLKSLEGDSPMTRGLGDIALPFAVPLYPKQLPGVDIQILGKSSKKSWLEEPTTEVLNPRRDYSTLSLGFTGPYNLIAQVRGNLPSFVDPTKTSEAEARMIVIGASGLVNESLFGPPNAALMLNIVDWLSSDAKLLAMRVRGQSEPPIQSDLSDAARNGVKIFNVVIVPLVLILYGVVRWRMRESRRKRLIASAP
jgi:ABC-type uncharacterized transport system involved in gliding motility auxiliary subunit